MDFQLVKLAMVSHLHRGEAFGLCNPCRACMNIALVVHRSSLVGRYDTAFRYPSLIR